MKKRQYNFLAYRFLWLLMALNVINLSIDVRDTALSSARVATYHEDLSVNQIESISEFVLEECLGLYNAVPEQDEPDDESEPSEPEQDYDFMPLYTFAPSTSSIQRFVSSPVPFLATLISVPVSEVPAPPPQRL